MNEHEFLISRGWEWKLTINGSYWEKNGSRAGGMQALWIELQEYRAFVGQIALNFAQSSDEAYWRADTMEKAIASGTMSNEGVERAGNVAVFLLKEVAPKPGGLYEAALRLLGIEQLVPGEYAKNVQEKLK